MNRDTFWEYVERASGSDAEEVERSLREILSPLSVAEIASFQRHFDEALDAAFTWDMLGAAVLMEGFPSDDFIDFRCNVIGLGRCVYEAAVRDPDSLWQNGVDFADEGIGCVASGLYEERVGDMLDRYQLEPFDVAGEEWDVDDPEEHARRLPRLYRKFGHRLRRLQRTADEKRTR